VSVTPASIIIADSFAPRRVSTPLSRFQDTLGQLKPGDRVVVCPSWTITFMGEMEWEFGEDLYGTVASVLFDAVDVDLEDGRRLVVTERNATSYSYRYEIRKAV